MKGSILRASLADTQRVTSKSRTWPAIRVVNADASKCVTGPMPERPLTMPSQLLARSLPSGEMMPRPVTTTRRLKAGRLDMDDSTCWRLRPPTGSHACLVRRVWTAALPAMPERHRAARCGPGLKRGAPAAPVTRIGHGHAPPAGLRLDVRLDGIDRLLDRSDLFGFLVRDLALELFLERHHQLDGVERIGTQVVDERSVVGDLVFLHAQLLNHDLLDALFDAAHCCYSSRTGYSME